jgi:hypothetical protein
VSVLLRQPGSFEGLTLEPERMEGSSDVAGCCVATYRWPVSHAELEFDGDRVIGELRDAPWR